MRQFIRLENHAKNVPSKSTTIIQQLEFNEESKLSLYIVVVTAKEFCEMPENICTTSH